MPCVNHHLIYNCYLHDRITCKAIPLKRRKRWWPVRKKIIVYVSNEDMLGVCFDNFSRGCRLFPFGTFQAGTIYTGNNTLKKLVTPFSFLAFPSHQSHFSWLTLRSRDGVVGSGQYFEHVTIKQVPIECQLDQTVQILQLKKCYLKTFLSKQHFHAGPFLVAKASMMVANSSFQGPLKYVLVFNVPYAIQYLIHTLCSKQ